MKTSYIIWIIAVFLLLAIGGCKHADVEVSGATTGSNISASGTSEIQSSNASETEISATEGNNSGNEGGSNETAGETETEKPLAEETITIINFRGEPEDLSIKVGTTVTWKNDMENMVQIIIILPSKETGVYSSKEINNVVRTLPGDSYSYIFNETGDYKWGSKTKFDKIYGFITVTE